MMTVKVGGRSVLSVPYHTQKSISQDSIHIFPFSDPGRCESGKAWWGGTKKRAERGRWADRTGFSQARLNVLRKIFRAPGWKSEERTKDTWNGTKVKADAPRLLSPPTSWEKPITNANWSHLCPTDFLGHTSSESAQMSSLTPWRTHVPATPLQSHPGCCSHCFP